MNAGIRQIIGKRIMGVVAKRRPQPPHDQLFLLFPDGTWFEIYTHMNELCTTSGVRDRGLQEVREYMGQEHIVLEVVDDSI